MPLLSSSLRFSFCLIYMYVCTHTSITHYVNNTDLVICCGTSAWVVVVLGGDHLLISSLRTLINMIKLAEEEGC